MRSARSSRSLPRTNITSGISSTSPSIATGTKKKYVLTRCLPVWLVPLTFAGERSGCATGWPPPPLFVGFGNIAVGKNESTSQCLPLRLISTVKAIGPMSAFFFGWTNRSKLTWPGYEKLSVQERRSLAGYG
jgi:hypothetical protein